MHRRVVTQPAVRRIRIIDESSIEQRRGFRHPNIVTRRERLDATCAVARDAVPIPFTSELSPFSQRLDFIRSFGRVPSAFALVGD